MKHWSRTVALGVGVLAASALAGCTGSGSSAASASSVASGSAAPASSAPGSATATSRATPAPSRTPVPPSPGPATPSVAVSTAPAVPIGRVAPLKPDVLVTVGSPRAVTVTARGPGEIAGPAVAVPVTVRNASSAPFDLGGLTVNAAYGRAGTPASPTEADPSDPLAGALAPEGSARGEYVFMAPAGALSSLRIEVSSNAAARILVFRS